jgi:hypothetical protein
MFVKCFVCDLTQEICDKARVVYDCNRVVGIEEGNVLVFPPDQRRPAPLKAPVYITDRSVIYGVTIGERLEDRPVTEVEFSRVVYGMGGVLHLPFMPHSTGTKGRLVRVGHSWVFEPDVIEGARVWGVDDGVMLVEFNKVVFGHGGLMLVRNDFPGGVTYPAGTVGRLERWGNNWYFRGDV